MRDWLRTLLFMSAFSPALITLAYVRYETNGWSTGIPQLAFIGALGSALPFMIMTLLRRHGEVFRIQIKKIESNDFMLVAFLVSYLLPLVLMGASVSVNTIFVILLVLGLVLLLTSSLPAHPLLRVLMRFKFYKVEASNGVVYTMISKRLILDPKDIKLAKRISPTMLMELQ
jgi:hypothetical protein